MVSYSTVLAALECSSYIVFRLHQVVLLALRITVMALF